MHFMRILILMITSNKKIKNATPLIFDGIEFRSKLEVYCYKKLKEANLNFKYEDVTYNLIPSFTYGGKLYEPYKKGSQWIFENRNNKMRGMTYTPDFVGNDWIIECKGRANDAFPLRWKLFKYLLTQLNINYDLYLPKNQSHIDECIRLINDKQNAGRKELL